MGVIGDIPIHELMAALAKRRTIFHSEADFQHELAWEFRLRDQSATVRLEVPSLETAVGTTDLVIHRSGRVHGIELKYLTRKLVHEVGGERFNLKAHGATDLRRYDVMKDIRRLEHFNKHHGGPSYILALTNDRAYWNSSNRLATIDAAFRIDHGRQIGGSLAWAAHAGAGSIKGREKPVELTGTYALEWRDYSAMPEIRTEFRYLCVRVDHLAHA